MNLAVSFDRYLEAFLRLVYPAYCGICPNFLRLEETALCSSCLNRLSSRHLSPEDALLKQRFRAVDEGWALYHYESPVKEIISAVKFLKKRWLLKIFREEVKTLASTLASETNYDGLIPVPLERGKLLEREFNQAELIARLLSACMQVPVRSRIVRKRVRTPSQSLLGREQRLANLLYAFETPRSCSLEGQKFLIVDDIVTTGATADEMARVLKNRGARRVDLFALATPPSLS